METGEKYLFRVYSSRDKKIRRKIQCQQKKQEKYGNGIFFKLPMITFHDISLLNTLLLNSTGKVISK